MIYLDLNFFFIKRCGIFVATLLFLFTTKPVFSGNNIGHDSLKTKNKRDNACDCSKYQALADKEFKALLKAGSPAEIQNRSAAGFKENYREPDVKKLFSLHFRHPKKESSKRRVKRSKRLKNWFKKSVSDCPKF